MTNQKELASYIMDQLAELGQVRNIPMMGGYVFYYKEKVFEIGRASCRERV